MSVYTSHRKISSLKYIQSAINTRKITMLVTKKFPKSYRWGLTNKILEMTQNIVINCSKANAIQIHIVKDFYQRRKYLMEAYSQLNALKEEITFCYNLIDEGNNFFKSKEDYTKKFMNWEESVILTMRLIKGIINKDFKKWSKIFALN